MTTPPSTLIGVVDYWDQERIHGWAADSARPEQAVEVDVFVDGEKFGTFLADRFREDLLKAGIGTGFHSFEVLLLEDRLFSRQPIKSLSVRISGTSAELPHWSSPAGPGRLINMKLDPMNIEGFLASPGQVEVDYLLIDINDTCNADCVYCPNLRSKSSVSMDQFRRLLDEKLKSVDVFQFGCGQEPTADSRLPEFFAELGKSRLKPGRVQMISNASLLHRTSPDAFEKSGVRSLLVSIDTLDEEAHNQIRVGIDLKRIKENIESLAKECPSIDLAMSVVVTRLTIANVIDLVDWGEKVGFSSYHFREVFDFTSGGDTSARRSDFREWMTKLSLAPGEFEELVAMLRAHPASAKFHYLPADGLKDFALETEASVRKVGLS